MGITCDTACVKASVYVCKKSRGETSFEQNLQNIDAAFMKLLATYYTDISTGITSTLFDDWLGAWHTIFELKMEEINKLLQKVYMYDREIHQTTKDDIAKKLSLLKETYYQDVRNRTTTQVAVNSAERQSLFRVTVAELKRLLRNLQSIQFGGNHLLPRAPR